VVGDISDDPLQGRIVEEEAIFTVGLRDVVAVALADGVLIVEAVVAVRVRGVVAND